VAQTLGSVSPRSGDPDWQVRYLDTFASMGTLALRGAAFLRHWEDEEPMAINPKRVLLSGLLAGLSVSVCGLGLVPIVGHEMDGVLARFQLPPLSPAAMAYFLFTSLALGIALVWLYAAFQPRMEPGVKTALVAALTVWVIGYALPNFANVAYGFMPLRLTVVGTLWGLLELGVGSLVGARLYREGGGVSSARPTNSQRGRSKVAAGLHMKAASSAESEKT
jgi:fatty acid desaturase